MITRRGMTLGLTGYWLSAGVPRVARADELGGAATAGGGTEALIALPGKKPLIKRAFRPPNYETPLADLAQPFTRNEAFFVRYHLAVIPEVDVASWRLRIGGKSTQRPLVLSLENLRREFKRVSIAAVAQCSGNRRGLFMPRVPGVQWGSGATGNALWSGVRLRDILQRAGVGADALEVVFNGADAPVLGATPDYLKSLPIDRALDENTLVAFEMNDRPLPHWNGAPARLVVPGWTATYWMKHLTEIRIEPTPYDGFWMKGAYRIPTGAFPGRRFASQENPETTPITEIMVNSLITSPVSGERLRRGAHAELAGKAWDNGAGIDSVAISTDGQRTWREATLGRDLGRFAWREFRWRIDTSSAGMIHITTRAHSRNGTSQPAKLTPNPSGYHHNLMQELMLEVA
ncbi:MAG TPA: molybdopterin-dependent oxidoreductase [Steroidobacteraceae bacterium]|nr:molybdopterin-dependent oxidoreductase [Steroidobacteraceae bacterium]